MSLCWYYGDCILDLFEPKEDNSAPALTRQTALTLSGEELTTAIERMGHLVLGVKALFDGKCNEKGNVTAYDIPGMLLDLCMSAETFTQARAYLTSKHIESMDFPQFLQLYACYSGVTAESYSKISAKEGIVPYWVPNTDGMWIEVHTLLLLPPYYY